MSSAGPDAIEPDTFLVENVEEPVQAYLDVLDANVVANSDVVVDLQTPELRGTVIIEGGVVLEPDRTFPVASNDFSLAGGDNYPVTEFVRLGVQYQQGLVEYLSQNRGWRRHPGRLSPWWRGPDHDPPVALG